MAIKTQVVKLRRAVRQVVFALWSKYTWWQATCPDCNGTGICHRAKRPLHNPSRHLQRPEDHDGEAWRYVHSCCGDCPRRLVPVAQLPVAFAPVYDGAAVIGTGVMYYRPWKPWRLYPRPLS